ncbi:phage terminase large subunit family protein [Nitrosomonas communis]|uniref:phage terminase large subunit family protein n=1 Tax=Nitrosomonas communis TaxID=44574 RepID=UPI003D2698E9
MSSSETLKYKSILTWFRQWVLPDPTYPLDEWADEYMMIPKETGAAEYGKYQISRTPHAREIYRCLSVEHPARRVVLKAASQMLKTQVALTWFCYIVHQHPYNLLWLMPTGKLHKRIVKRIDKTINAVPVVRERVAKPNRKSETNSQDIKEFKGGNLYLATAGSAANLAEVPARFVSYDEIDSTEADVDGEGDSVKLAESRQTTFSNKAKSYYYSSPKGDEDSSKINKLYLDGTQRVALAECVHCGHAQELVFERLVMTDDGTVMYPCEACGGMHRESDKTQMFKNGLWSDPVQESENETFCITAMYQPYGWLTWAALYDQHQKALVEMGKGLEEEMIVFYNTRLARCWKRTMDIADHETLKERAESYTLRIAPNGTLLITVGVDTQNNRLAVQIVGWGKNLTAWVIDYVELPGDPANPQVWDSLTELIKAGVQHESGAILPISAVAIDVGGHRGEAVKNYVRSKRIHQPIAIFGAAKANSQPLSKGTMVDINYKGVLDKKGVMLHAVGTIGIKDVIFARIKNDAGKEPGNITLHFSDQLPPEYFPGIVSETYNRKTGKYDPKPGVRNEPLDTLVYAYAALHHQTIRAHRFTEKDWQALESRLYQGNTNSLAGGKISLDGWRRGK